MGGFNRVKADARNHLPGTSDTAMEQEIFNVLTEFCEDSAAWQENISFTSAPTVTSYLLTPVQPIAGAAGQLTMLINVLDANLIPVIASMAALTPPSATIVLQNQPNVAQAFTALMIKKPMPMKDWDDQIPQFLYDTYHRVLLDGLIGKMMEHPGKPYSNDEKATYHLKRFRDGIATTRVLVIRQNTWGTNSWIFPQGYATRSQRGGVSVGNNFGFGG